ncbi:PREDICTED: uncharacterized protein LOC107335405 [Acropora digitifera]|uniref:uncharacterized protein LOC107335405 n=1 Tax=Acropora digitifera TaxID=70779 RepID=UPI00077A8797|nr:PREDICTED: uncharacterized protein LOC107335405 [Acropora digitifera]
MASEGLSPMDLSGSASQVAEKWRKWKRAFEYYAQDEGIDNARKKTSQLLYFAGMEVQDIFEDLQEPGPIPESARTSLRDQLIEKLTDFELKRKLLEQRNITLEETLDKARAWEAAGPQASNMTTSPPLADGNSINMVKERQRMTNDERRKCYNCGREGHLARDRNCPASGKKCAKCGRYGNFALCCRGERDVIRGRESKQQRNSGGRPRYVANFVGNEEASESNEDCAFAFMVSEVEEDICHTIICDEPVIEICVDGISTKVLIDSGYISNIIGVKLPKTLVSIWWEGVERGWSSGAVSWNQEDKLTICGHYEWKARCLPGHITSRDLGLLRIGLGASSESAECNVVSKDLASALQTKYPKVFSGIGNLKEYRLKLHVDPEVTPVAQKPRRVPFALREKLTAKVEDLIAKDIVERVDGSTSWVSPVVVAPKSEGDIRLCVDMRKANQAIIRERIPIPTVDEVVENLNGSAVFSKLDLRLGFHQIELDEESGDITTFATHEGLFRYKRLSFEVNSAPGKYQQIIRQVVSDIEVVLNIADDLVVHGKSIEEHDQSLHKVLQRLEEKNLTLNPMKC